MKLYSPGDGWQTLSLCYRTASVQAPGVSMPRLLLRRFKRRTAIAPTRYHAPLLSLFVPRHYGTRHNVAPPLGLCSSQGTRLSPPCRACLPRSFRFARRSSAMLRHAQAHAPAMPPSYSVVKSFPTLPIRQSKAVTIALSVGYGSAILSESSRLRLHPTLLPCLERPQVCACSQARSPAMPRIQRFRAV